MTFLSTSSCSPSTHFSFSHCEEKSHGEQAAGTGFFVVVVFFFKAKSYHYSSLQAQEPHSESLMEAYQDESELEMRLPRRYRCWGGGGWVVAFLKK